VGHQDRKVGGDLEAVVSVGDGVERICGEPRKAELGGDGFAVEGESASGKGACAERHEVEAADRTGKPFVIADQHPAPGAQVVRKGDGLGALEVGVAGHEGAGMLSRNSREGFEEANDRGQQFGHAPLEVEPLVERDLVIAAPSGMHLAARIPEPVGEDAFDERMDVLGAGIDLERSRFELCCDLFKFRHNGRGLGRRNDAGRAEHARMGDAAGDVVEGHAGIDIDRCFKGDGRGIRSFCEASVPQRGFSICHRQFPP